MSADFPSTADIVIVGAGAIGSSIFYHLTKVGVKNVVLLERYQIASGTTFHSAAQVPPLGPTRAETIMAQYSIGLYGELEAETGQATGWRRCGFLNTATNEGRLDQLRHYLSTLHALGVEGHMISPEEVKERWPLVNTDDIIGGLWMPGTGRVDPTDICQAFIKGGKMRGGRLFEDTPVTDWIIASGKVQGVKTARGDIAAPIVVNCTGLWGRKTGKMAGVDLPLFACEHFYLLTDQIEGVRKDLPILRNADCYLYIREDGGGLLVGCFEPNPKPLPVENIPDAPFTLMNEDWDHFAPRLDDAVHRIPALANAGARQLVNGPESFTMDHAPLIGEAPEVEGYWVAVGMNSFGITLAGGVGWVMADWITKGVPPIDVSPLDVRRFSKRQNNLHALSQRIPEVLSHHHVIPWPGSDYDTVRNQRRSPFYPIQAEHGAFFNERGGWERPAWYAGKGKVAERHNTFRKPSWFGNWAEEHLAARNGVAIFDGSPLSKILVQGRDAMTFLNRIFANETDIEPGRSVYSLMLNRIGGIESDPLVCRLERDVYFITTGSGQGVRDLNWLKRNIRDDEFVVLTDVSQSYGTLMVAGPHSENLLQAYSSDDLSLEAFPVGAVRDIEIGYTTAKAIRFSYTGEPGFELHIGSDSAQAVLEHLMTGTDGVAPRLGGSHALNSLRTEKGFRSWGHDMGCSDRPRESGLNYGLSLKKSGDYIGKEAVLAERGEPQIKRLMAFLIDDPEVFPHGDEAIYRNGELAGLATSSTFGHSLGTGIGLLWVEKGDVSLDAIAKDTFEIEVADQRHKITLTTKSPLAFKG